MFASIKFPCAIPSRKYERYMKIRFVFAISLQIAIVIVVVKTTPVENERWLGVERVSTNITKLDGWTKQLSFRLKYLRDLCPYVAGTEENGGATLTRNSLVNVKAIANIGKACKREATVNEENCRGCQWQAYVKLITEGHTDILDQIQKNCEQGKELISYVRLLEYISREVGLYASAKVNVVKMARSFH